MRNTKAVSISLSARELAQAERLAKQTNRSLSGLVREGLNRLHAEQRATRRAEADEYTPAQRRRIDKDIAKGLEEIENGRFHGPFASAKEVGAYLNRLAEDRAGKPIERKPMMLVAIVSERHPHVHIREKE